MSDLATQARQAAEHCEARHHGRRDHADSGASLLTVEVMTEDLPACVRDATPGQRFMVAFVPINDDGTPKLIAVKSRGEALRIKACVLSGDREFQAWAADFAECPDNRTPAEIARGEILYRCGITSRADLATNSAACDRFEDMLEQFEASQGRRYFRETKGMKSAAVRT